jgi:deazaflavin-dependent oxidoreductase (nitroreductase family)
MTVMKVGTAKRGTATRPVLGLRQRPGRLALFVFRLPLPLYRAEWGWLLGHVFLVLTHAGRRTGRPHDTAAMVLAEDPTTEEVVICSGWGPRTDWVRNLRAKPPLLVRIGGQSYVPQHRFLTDEEAFEVGASFRRRHPVRLRMVKLAFGVDLRSDDTLREFVRTRPFVALRPRSAKRE